MARTNFSGPVISAAGFETGIGGVFKLPSYLKTAVPPATTNAGALIYVSDATGGACPMFSNGTNWLRVDTSAIMS